MACEFARSFPRNRAELVVIVSAATPRTSGGSVILAISPGELPVNHMFPSVPSAIDHGLTIKLSPLEYSVMSPSVVMRPIRPGAVDSVNQSAPSGPAAMPSGPEFMVSPELNSSMSPWGVIRPMPPGSAFSVNQRLPSGPLAMSAGSLLPEMPLENSVMTPSVVMRPILPPPSR